MQQSLEQLTKVNNPTLIATITQGATTSCGKLDDNNTHSPLAYYILYAKSAAGDCSERHTQNSSRGVHTNSTNQEHTQAAKFSGGM